MKLSVVIAAYDEAANVEPLTRGLEAALATIPDCSWELVFVVEGEDGTHEALQRLAQTIAGLRILYRRQPAGIGAAFRRGFAAVAADADYVVTMDADLNHQPEEIPRLLATAQRLGCDILVGSRFVSGSAVTGIPWWKRWLSGTINRLMSRLYGLRVRDKTSGFRVYRAAFLRQAEVRRDDFAFLPELLIRAATHGYSIAEEPITFHYRRRGRSKMAFWRTSVSYLALLGSLLDRWTWGALVLLAIGVALRIAAEFPAHRYPADGDCVLTGLSAFRLLHGHPPVFFASPRLGAVGAYVAAPLFLVFGASRATLAAAPMLVDILQLVVWYLLLHEVLGRRIALLALPFAAVPSPALTYWTYMPNGYPETVLLCTTTLWLAARLARGDERKLTVFALGLSAGLGWWCSFETLACTVPAVAWLAWRRRRLFADGAAVRLVALGFLLGALPWIASNIRYPLASLRNSYAARPATGVGALLANGRYVFTDQLPELVTPVQSANATNVVHRWLRWPTLLIVDGAALWCLVMVPLLGWRRAARRGPAATGKEPASPGGTVLGALSGETRRAVRVATPVFLLVLGVTLALNMVSEAGSARGPTSTVRYVLPILLLVPALLGLALGRLGSWSRPLASLLAAIVIAFNLAGTLLPWTPERRQWSRDEADFNRVLRILEQQKVAAVFGSYWVVYPLNFLSREAILGIPDEAENDYRHEIARLPTTPVRWALLGYSTSDLARVARGAGLQGETRSIGMFALLLPLQNPPPEETPEHFRRRLVSASKAPGVRCQIERHPSHRLAPVDGRRVAIR